MCACDVYTIASHSNADEVYVGGNHQLHVPFEESEQSSQLGDVEIQKTAVGGEKGVGYDQRKIKGDGVTSQYHPASMVAGNLLSLR